MRQYQESIYVSRYYNLNMFFMRNGYKVPQKSVVVLAYQSSLFDCSTYMYFVLYFKNNEKEVIWHRTGRGHVGFGINKLINESPLVPLV